MPFLSLPDSKLRYRESGTDRAGTPVFFIHGAGGSSAIWIQSVLRVGRLRRAVAVDFPGHGRSPGAMHGFDDWLNTTGAAAAALCLGRAILVGHSLGGLVALAAALEWPDKVAGLVLVTTSARFAVSARLFQKIDTDFAHWPEFLQEGAYSPETPIDVRRRSAAIACAASQAQTRADFEACLELDARARLHEIAVPTLVVTGRHDLMAAPKWGDELAEKIPDARHLPLACGHFPMHEQPDPFHQALLALVGVIP